MDDQELLLDYVRTGSQHAFATLVERHVDLVYSAALRRTNGDPHRAKEVTQMVFIDLAKKAAALTKHTLLVGWLYRSTSWAAANLFRAERRRLAHEQRAAEFLATPERAEQAVDWTELRPVIDRSLDDLRDSEREAILLRFFLNLPFADVGQKLGISENSARMRVSRALEKLQAALRRQGVTATAVALGLVLTQHSVSAAPLGLASTLTATSLTAASAVGAGGVAVVTTGVFMSKLNATVLAVLLAALSVGVVRERALLAAEQLSVGDEQVRRNAGLAARQRQVSEPEASMQGESSSPPVIATVDPVLVERKRLDLIIRKGELDRDYATLFWRLKLDGPTLDALKALIVERNQAIYDANQLAKTEGVEIASYAENMAVNRAATREVDARIAALLGDEKSALVLGFEESPYLKVLRPEVVGAEESERRARELGALWDRFAPAYLDANFASPVPLPLPEEFVHQAQAWMSAENHARLVKKQKTAAAWVTMSEIAAEAAYAGKLRLTKNSAKNYGQPMPPAPVEIPAARKP